jgi:regulatory protein YycH of two-component signal transduction system YycFG
MPVLLACLVLGLVLTFISPDMAEGAKKSRSRRLVKPWSELTTLSEDQKTRIIDLHQQANEDRKAIDRREREQILAELTEPQLNELRDLEEKKSADRKAKEAKKRDEKEKAQETED